MARTDELNAESVPEAPGLWVKPALDGQAASAVLAASTGVYNTSAAPAAAGGNVFGFVVAGAKIDSTFARTLKNVSQGEIVIVGDRVLGSTLSGKAAPWQTRSEWLAATGSEGGSKNVRSTGSATRLT